VRHARRGARVSMSARVFSLAHRSDSFVVYLLEGLQHVSFPGIQEKSNFNLDPALEDEFLGDIKPSVHSHITGITYSQDYLHSDLFQLFTLACCVAKLKTVYQANTSREETGNECAASTQFSRVSSLRKRPDGFIHS